MRDHAKPAPLMRVAPKPSAILIATSEKGAQLFYGPFDLYSAAQAYWNEVVSPSLPLGWNAVVQVIDTPRTL